MRFNTRLVALETRLLPTTPFCDLNIPVQSLTDAELEQLVADDPLLQSMSDEQLHKLMDEGISPYPDVQTWLQRTKTHSAMHPLMQYTN